MVVHSRLQPGNLKMDVGRRATITGAAFWTSVMRHERAASTAPGNCGEGCQVDFAQGRRPIDGLVWREATARVRIDGIWLFLLPLARGPNHADHL